MSDHGLATVRGRLLARLGRLIEKPPRLDAVERFAAHLAVEFPAVFAFLWDPSVDATNWRAEQAIRPAVVTAKSAGAIALAAGRTPNRCSPPWCGPLTNVTSTSPP